MGENPNKTDNLNCENRNNRNNLNGYVICSLIHLSLAPG
jgi:hypothetical protein